MPSLDDPNDLLDDQALSSTKHLTPYRRWIGLGALLLVLAALGGLVLFGGILFSILKYDILSRPHIRINAYLMTWASAGSLLCCVGLLLAGLRVFQQDKTLRVSAAMPNRRPWLEASPQQRLVWRNYGLAFMLLIAAWSPILVYNGIDALRNLPEFLPQEEQPQMIIDEIPDASNNASKAPISE